MPLLLTIGFVYVDLKMLQNDQCLNIALNFQNQLGLTMMYVEFVTSIVHDWTAHQFIDLNLEIAILKIVLYNAITSDRSTSCNNLYNKQRLSTYS